MSRWTGSWLSGPRAALEPGEDAGDREPSRWRGERLGLPERGPGSVSSTAARAFALIIDLVLASLVTSLLVRPDVAQVEVMTRFNYAAVLVWFVITALAVSFFGFTPGMFLLGIRVARLDGANMVGPLRALPRTVLVALIVPAAIWDADGRGLHDKLVGTVVVRTR